MTNEEIGALLHDPRVSNDDKDNVRFFGGTDEPEIVEGYGPGGMTVVEFCERGYDGPGWYAWCEDYPDEGSARLASLGRSVTWAARANRRRRRREGPRNISRGAVRTDFGRRL